MAALRHGAFSLPVGIRVYSMLVSSVTMGPIPELAIESLQAARQLDTRPVTLQSVILLGFTFRQHTDSSKIPVQG